MKWYFKVFWMTVGEINALDYMTKLTKEGVTNIKVTQSVMFLFVTWTIVWYLHTEEIK